jgi:hypothetical protein
MAATENKGLDWLLEQLAWECTLARLHARAQLRSETNSTSPEPRPGDIPGPDLARRHGAEEAREVRAGQK